MHQTQQISACRLIPLLLQRGYHRSTWSASGWSLRCSKRVPSPDSQGSRVPRCAVAVSQGAWVQAESLGCKAECGSLFTRLEETTTAIAGGAGQEGQGVLEAADFAILFMQKSQNEQTWNDNYKAFSCCAARENIENVFRGWLMGGGKMQWQK